MCCIATRTAWIVRENAQFYLLVLGVAECASGGLCARSCIRSGCATTGDAVAGEIQGAGSRGAICAEGC